MFTASPSELSHAEDLFEQLCREAAALSGNSSPRKNAKLEAQQDLITQRSLRAAQAMMARLAWRPKLSVALVNRCTCQSCHSEHLRFEGFGIEMFRQSDGAKRIVATPQLDPAYPREVYYSHTVLAACPECLPQHGFTLQNHEQTS